jgi:hypothetical protein
MQADTRGQTDITKLAGAFRERTSALRNNVMLCEVHTHTDRRRLTFESVKMSLYTTSFNIQKLCAGW